jgi:hypothetical protein
VASVSAAGLVMAAGLGNATIQATIEGRSALAAVSVVPPPPSISVSSSLATVMAYNPVTIAWSTANTVSCAAEGSWSGSLATSGTREVIPVDTGTAAFRVRCLGTNGQTQLSGTTVGVIPATSFPQNCSLAPEPFYTQNEYLLGRYKISNNSWSYDVQRRQGADTSGGYHEQCVSGRLTEAGVETTIRWHWDAAPGQRNADIGYGWQYPNVFYGVDPNMRGSSYVDLPKRISEIGNLTLTYDVKFDSTTQKDGMFQLLHEAWFVSDLPARPESIVMEIGISTLQRRWWNPPPVDSVTFDGVLYDVMPKSVGVEGRPRVNIWFITRADHVSGTIDFPKFIDYVVRKGYLSPTAYLAIVQSGPEIFYGSGKVTINMRVNR